MELPPFIDSDSDEKRDEIAVHFDCHTLVKMLVMTRLKENVVKCKEAWMEIDIPFRSGRNVCENVTQWSGQPMIRALQN